MLEERYLSVNYQKVVEGLRNGKEKSSFYQIVLFETEDKTVHITRLYCK